MRPRRFGWARLLCLALLASGALLEGVHAETHALVVGIDDYARVRRLRGAVNDAKDISNALQRRGVKDLTTLTDAAATRSSVLAALNALVERAKRDDLVIVSFAGHGSSETWGPHHPPDVKTGESYQVFLLRDFLPPDASGRLTAEDRKGFGERILGREMREVFKRLEEKGARTVFVADACHGGGLSREIVKGAPPQTYRLEQYPTPRESEDPIAPLIVDLPPAFEHLKAVPSLTFLAAVSSKDKSPEVEIPAASQVKRGALSYAFARLVEGEGDADHDGILTREEAYRFTRATVKQFAQFRQTPELQPTEEIGAVLTRSVIDFGRDMAPLASPGEAPVSALVRIFVDGDGTVLASARPRNGVSIVQAPDRSAADLIWEPGSGRLVSKLGDQIANGVGADSLGAIAEREVALRQLLAFAGTRTPIEMRLQGGDRLYHRGDKVRAEARTNESEDPYYILFNIASDGTVQYLYPRPELNDSPRLERGKPLLEPDVKQPYGADTMVLLVSRAPLADLATALLSLDETRAPLEAVNRIRSAKIDDLRLTTQAIFTAP